MTSINLWGGCDITATTAVLGLVVFLGVLFLVRGKKRKNYPPGPTGLPLLGYMPFFGDNPAKILMKLKKQYGPVMSVRVGRDDWIVLNDFDVAHEALVKRGESFSGRPNNEFYTQLTEDKSFILADYGERWKTLRKFGLTTLRGFGVGKKGMEANIIEETPFLVANLTSDSKLSLRSKVMYAVSNIICRVVFGSRFTYDDEEFVELLELMEEEKKDTLENKLVGLLDLAPFLQHLPFFKGALKVYLKGIDVYLNTFKKIKDKHMDTFDKNDIRDFIDAFIKEMKNRGDKDEIFDDKQLLYYISDLFEAGTATTTGTLLWTFLAFLHYPECQEKIFAEIEATIGESGTPTMKHCDEMPYTRAFIQEIMRHRILVPLSVLHKTNGESTLNGYTIPKNSTIVPNIWAIHYDPATFKDPEEFRPERFIDGEGKFIKSNRVIPFSIGPRHCLGEQLAKTEIFIFLVGIVQKLRLLPDPAHPPPPLDSGIYRILLFESHEFRAIFEKR